GGVIDEDGFVFLRAERGGRVGLNDLPHRHEEVAARAFDVDFARVWHGFDRRVIDARSLGEKFWIGVHGAPPTRAEGERRDGPLNASLRRHYPHQVRRVCSHPARQNCSDRTPTLLERTLLQAVGVWQAYQLN